MNIDVKDWSDKNLSEIFNKDTLIKIVLKKVHSFEIDRKISSECIAVRPTHMGKIIYFEKKKNDLFFLQNTLSRYIVKIVFMVIFMGMASIPFTNAEKPIVNYVTIQVSSGDTVWTIAGRNASKEEDIRELVYEIKTINDLDGNGLIYPGQLLKVPTMNNFNR